MENLTPEQKRINDALTKIVKTFSPDNIITSEEIDQVLKGIMEILASYKKGTDAINEETKAVVNILLDKVVQTNKQTLDKAEIMFDDRMTDLETLLKDVKQMITDVETLASEVKDGKDADEEKIVEDVVNRIKLEPTIVTLSAEEVRDRLSSLKDESRLDKSAIKGLDKILQQSDLDYAIATLQHQTSFLINRGGIKSIVAGSNITVDNTDPSNPVISSTGDGSIAIGDTITSATQGSILFAGASGVLAQDNSSLFFDDTNNRLGLLTTAPTHTLTLGSTSTGISLYNTADQTTNYERALFEWSANVFRLIVDNAGTGTDRAIVITNSLQTITFGAAGAPKLTFAAGSSTGTGPFHAFTGTSTASSGAVVFSSITPTISQSSTAGYTALLVNPTENTTGSGTKLLADLQVGGSSKVKIDNAGNITTLGSIELGNASDTTLSRSSAGVLAVEGVVIPSISSTNTLTNKTISGASNTLSNISMGSLTFLGVRVTSSAGQSIGTTLTAVNFDTETYDTNTMHDNVTNNTRITFTTAGYYHVSGVLSTDGNQASYLGVRLNGTTYIFKAGAGNAGVSTANGTVISFEYNFSAADYIELMGAFATTQTTKSGVDGTFFSAYRIG